MSSTRMVNFMGISTMANTGSDFDNGGYTRDRLREDIGKRGLNLSVDQENAVWELFDLNADARLTREEVEAATPVLVGMALDAQEGEMPATTTLLDTRRLDLIMQHVQSKLTSFRFCGKSLYELLKASSSNVASLGSDSTSYFKLNQEEFVEMLKALQLDAEFTQANYCGVALSLDSVVEYLFKKLDGGDNNLSITDFPSGWKLMAEQSAGREGDGGAPIPEFDMAGSGEGMLTLDGLKNWVGADVYELVYSLARQQQSRNDSNAIMLKRMLGV